MMEQQAHRDQQEVQEPMVQPVLSVHKAQLEMMEQQGHKDQQEVQELMVQPVHKARLG
jgi:hypothetical protein